MAKKIILTKSERPGVVHICLIHTYLLYDILQENLLFNSLILQSSSLVFSNHRLEKYNLPWTTFNEIILYRSQVVRKVHFIHSFRIFRLPHASGLKWLGEVKKSMKLSLVPLMRLGSFRNYPSTYVPTYTPLNSTNLGS